MVDRYYLLVLCGNVSELNTCAFCRRNLINRILCHDVMFIKTLLKLTQSSDFVFKPSF